MEMLAQKAKQEEAAAALRAEEEAKAVKAGAQASSRSQANSRAGGSRAGGSRAGVSRGRYSATTTPSMLLQGVSACKTGCLPSCA